jgi:hypothetical protein
LNLLQSVIGDYDPKELFKTMVAFMHQTVAHQKKMEVLLQQVATQLEDIQGRLEKLEQRETESA